MTVKESADEQPKKKIAKRVVTSKREYFLPHIGVSVEARSPLDAVARSKRSTKVKDGDE